MKKNKNSAEDGNKKETNPNSQIANNGKQNDLPQDNKQHQGSGSAEAKTDNEFQDTNEMEDESNYAENT